MEHRAARHGGWVGLLAALLAFLPCAPGMGPAGGAGSDGAPAGDETEQPPPRGTGVVDVALSAATGTDTEADAPWEGGIVIATGEGDVRRGRIDEAGRARIEGLAPGRYRVTIQAPGWVLEEREVDVTEEGATSLEFSMRRAATILVHVRSHEPHERRSPDDPPDGARVMALFPGRQLPRFAPAGPGDPARLDTLPPETDLVVHATAEGHEAEQRVVTTPAAGEVTELTITLSPAALLAGVVVGPDGAPMPNARVVLAGSGVWPPRERLTDEAGRFAWPDVPAGIYELRAAKENLVAEPRTGLVVSRREAPPFVRLALGYGVTLTGRVHTAEQGEGEGLEGVEVVALEDALSLVPRATRTGADGTFAISGLLPRAHLLRISADGYVTQTVTHEPSEGPVDIVLVPAATLAGHVLDDLGHPVEGAELEILDDTTHPAVAFRDLFSVQASGPIPIASDGSLGVTLGQVPPIPIDPMARTGAVTGRATTDTAGAFRIEGISPGRVQVRVRAEGYAPLVTESITLRPGEAREGVEIILVPGTLIDGRVVDASDFPVANVMVELRVAGQPPQVTATAGDGTFAFDAVRGDVVLTASPVGLPAVRERIEVPPPERFGQRRDVLLRLDTTLHTLRGRVMDRDEMPVPGAMIRLRTLSARHPHQRVMAVSEDGTFEIGGLPPPPYELIASSETLAEEELEVESAGPDDPPLEIILFPSGTLRGTVEDDLGPVAEVEVKLVRDGRVRRRIYSDAEGQFTFERVAVGDYQLELVSLDHLPATAAASLILTRWETVGYVDPIMLTRGAFVEGTVVDALGEAVPNADVVPSADVPWNEGAETNDEGHFVLGPIAAGDLPILARHEAAGTGSALRPVRVGAGERVSDVHVRLAGRLPLSTATESDNVLSAEGSEPATSGERATGVAIVVERDGDDVVIDAVAAGSRAARAGLRVGDRILEIDDMAVYSAGGARAALRGPEGVEAILRIQRGSRERTIVVARERYTVPD